MSPNMLKLLPLVSKTLDELTGPDFKLIATTLGLKVELTDELKTAAMAMLKGQDINTVADLIQKPDSVKQLLEFVSPPKSDEPNTMVARCKHCGEFSIHPVPLFA